MQTMPAVPAEKIRVLHGPSVFMERAAVVIEFQVFTDGQIAPQRLYKTFSDLKVGIAAEQVSVFCPAGEAIGPHHLVACIARWLDVQARPGRPPMMSLAVSRHGDTFAVAGAFIDPGRARKILRGALSVARIVLAQCSEQSFDAGVAPERLETVRRLCAQSVVRAEMGQEYTMFWVRARQRGIPPTFLEGTPKVLLLGNGRRGRLLRATSNDRDSAVGTMLAGDKAWSNHLVDRLGFPRVRHMIVTSDEAAQDAVKVIGFPLVVKPVANGKGTGVFAGLTTLEECLTAFREASKHSRRGVLIEGHVAGDDHRLAVFGGQLAWVVARRPAFIIGDGQRSIQALVDAENARRRALPVADRPFITLIDVDPELLGHLAKSGLSPNSVPPAGHRVVLRSIANVSKGGVYEDVSERVHPDNREMAETIAAAFRMDAMGIDFITTDISRSWRDIGGAIIEVNETPAAGTPHYVDAVLDRMFPDKSRMPYVLFVNDHDGVATRNWVAKARGRGHVVGVVTSSSTTVNDHVRGRGDQSINERMQSLTLDSRVGIFVARVTAEEVERDGLLLEQIDQAFLGDGVPSRVDRLIRRHAIRVSAMPA